MSHNASRTVPDSWRSPPSGGRDRKTNVGADMRTIRIIVGLAAATLVTACEPPLPESGARGVGFDTPEQAAQRRDAQLSGQAPLRPQASVLPPAPGTAVASAAPSEAEDLASQTRAALGRPATTSPTTPPAQLPQTTATASTDLNLDRDNPSISREQDFNAVTAQRDMAADAGIRRSCGTSSKTSEPAYHSRLPQPEPRSPQGGCGGT